eukprot:1134179-Pelagomonas_calceolata.AAC.5
MGNLAGRYHAQIIEILHVRLLVLPGNHEMFPHRSPRRKAGEVRIKGRASVEHRQGTWLKAEPGASEVLGKRAGCLEGGAR